MDWLIAFLTLLLAAVSMFLFRLHNSIGDHGELTFMTLIVSVIGFIAWIVLLIFFGSQMNELELIMSTMGVFATAWVAIRRFGVASEWWSCA